MISNSIGETKVFAITGLVIKVHYVRRIAVAAIGARFVLGLV
jgi:hypothetical protein